MSVPETEKYPTTLPSASVAARTEAVAEGAEDDDEAVALEVGLVEELGRSVVGRPEDMDGRMLLIEGRPDVADTLSEVIDGSSDDWETEGRSEDMLCSTLDDERGTLEVRTPLDDSGVE